MFQLFRYRKHRNKPKHNRNRYCFCLFRFEPKILFVCFEDTLPLCLSKNIANCVGMQGLSIGTPLDPLFCGWTIPLTCPKLFATETNCIFFLYIYIIITDNSITIKRILKKKSRLETQLCKSVECRMKLYCFGPNPS